MLNPITQNNQDIQVKTNKFNNKTNNKLHQIESKLLKKISFVYGNQLTTNHYNVKKLMQQIMISDWNPMPIPLRDDEDIQNEKDAYKDMNWNAFWRTHTIIRVPKSTFTYSLLYKLYDSLNLSIDKMSGQKQQISYFADNKYGYFSTSSNILNDKYKIFDNFAKAAKVNKIDFKHKLIGKPSISNEQIKNLINKLRGIQNVSIVNDYNKKVKNTGQTPDDLLHYIDKLLYSKAKQLIQKQIILPFNKELDKVSYKGYQIKKITPQMINKMGKWKLHNSKVNIHDYFAIELTGKEIMNRKVIHYEPINYAIVNYITQRYIVKLEEGIRK